MTSKRIMAILNEICGAGPGELEPDLELFETGLLDSFGVVQLLVKLEEEFGEAPDIESFTREEIATPVKLVAFLEKIL